MHADDAIRPLRSGGEHRYGNGRSIRGENDFRAQRPICLGKNFSLELDLFGDSLDREVRSRNCFKFCNGLDTGQYRRLLRLGELAFANLAVEIFRDRFQTSIEKTLFDIAQNDLKAAAREHMGDAIAHGASTEDGDNVNRVRIQRQLRLSEGLCKLVFGIGDLAAELPNAIVANSGASNSLKECRRIFIWSFPTKTASLGRPHLIDKAIGVLRSETRLEPTS